MIANRLPAYASVRRTPPPSRRATQPKSPVLQGVWALVYTPLRGNVRKRAKGFEPSTFSLEASPNLGQNAFLTLPRGFSLCKSCEPSRALRPVSTLCAVTPRWRRQWDRQRRRPRPLPRHVRRARIQVRRAEPDHECELLRSRLAETIWTTRKHGNQRNFVHRMNDASARRFTGNVRSSPE